MAAPVKSAATTVVSSAASMLLSGLRRAIEQAVGQRARMSPELGDDGACLLAHGDVINAAARSPMALRRLGQQARTQPGRRQERHAAMLRHGAKTIGVASEGQGAIR